MAELSLKINSEYKAEEMEITSSTQMGIALISPATNPWPVSNGESDQAPKVLLLGFFLAALQAVDGVLTSIGVTRFGTSIEGNPMLRQLMEHFGHIPTLAILKLIAIIIVLSLTYLAQRRPWVHNAMGALTCVYLVAAILPWTYILFIKG